VQYVYTQDPDSDDWLEHPILAARSRIIFVRYMDRQTIALPVSLINEDKPFRHRRLKTTFHANLPVNNEQE
jgi:hypothetical protein